MQSLPPDPLQRANEFRIAQETEWARLASEGDSVALTNLYETYIDSVYRYMYIRVDNISEAEELTSETFTRAIEGLLLDKSSLQGYSFRSWLFDIASNLLKEHYWKNQKSEVLDNSLKHTEQTDENADLVDSFLREEEQEALWQMIKELPTEEQSILVMRHVYELSYAEIAQRLGRSENACKQLHYRSLKKLKLKAQERD